MTVSGDQTGIILSVHYLPSVTWFRLFCREPQVTLDIHEHYVKQSYRNRCRILSANGPLDLTIPVKKKAPKMPVQEIGIEQEFNWQKQHWEAIRSAYNSSPYFEFYAHHFEPFFRDPAGNLTDFSLALIRVCLKILKLDKPLHFSTAYVPVEEGKDLRLSIHPKKRQPQPFKPYLQVFADRFAFEADLSILDLLFNEGPAAAGYLLADN